MRIDYHIDGESCPIAIFTDKMPEAGKRTAIPGFVLKREWPSKVIGELIPAFMVKDVTEFDDRIHVNLEI